MIDLSPVSCPVLPATAGSVPAPVAASDGASAPPGSFWQTLGAFLDAHDAALDEPAPPQQNARQALAEDGKDVPVAAPAPDDTVDPAADPDAMLAWFAALPPSPIAVPTPAGKAGGGTTADPSSAFPAAPVSGPAPGPATLPLPPVAASPLPSGDAPAVLSNPRPDSAAPATATAQLAQAAVQPSARGSVRGPRPDGSDTAAPPASVPDAPLPDAAVPTATSRIASAVAGALGRMPGIGPDAPVAAASADRPAPPPRGDPAGSPIAVSAVPQPASQVFAAAIAAAGSWRDRDSRAARGEPGDTVAAFATPAALDLRERAIVQATADAGGAALDLTGDPGLNRMIDRIETLRDTANAGDTRVRLVPDALGSIDVAVRQEGDRIHVRFTAEHDTTRALIAEAQPRLTELAAARGVRIGETSVTSGGMTDAPGNRADASGGGAMPQPRPAPSAPRAPTATQVASAIESPTDQRLA